MEVERHLDMSLDDIISKNKARSGGGRRHHSQAEEGKTCSGQAAKGDGAAASQSASGACQHVGHYQLAPFMVNVACLVTLHVVSSAGACLSCTIL